MTKKPRYRSANQRAKDKIRKRDRTMYEKRWICMLCGEHTKTQLHHLAYNPVYDERAVLELCETCHHAIHGLAHDMKNIAGVRI